VLSLFKCVRVIRPSPTIRCYRGFGNRNLGDRPILGFKLILQNITHMGISITLKSLR